MNKAQWQELRDSITAKNARIADLERILRYVLEDYEDTRTGYITVTTMDKVRDRLGYRPAAPQPTDDEVYEREVAESDAIIEAKKAAAPQAAPEPVAPTWWQKRILAALDNTAYVPGDYPLGSPKARQFRDAMCELAASPPMAEPVEPPGGEDMTNDAFDAAKNLRDTINRGTPPSQDELAAAQATIERWRAYNRGFSDGVKGAFAGASAVRAAAPQDDWRERAESAEASVKLLKRKIDALKAAAPQPVGYLDRDWKFWPNRDAGRRSTKGGLRPVVFADASPPMAEPVVSAVEVAVIYNALWKYLQSIDANVRTIPPAVIRAAIEAARSATP